MVARLSQIMQLAGGKEQRWCLHLRQWMFILMEWLSRENACYIKHLTSAEFQVPAVCCPVPGVRIPCEVCCCQHSDSMPQVEGKIVMISPSDSCFGWVKLCCHALNPLLITRMQLCATGTSSNCACGCLLEDFNKPCRVCRNQAVSL